MKIDYTWWNCQFSPPHFALRRQKPVIQTDNWQVGNETVIIIIAPPAVNWISFTSLNSPYKPKHSHLSCAWKTRRSMMLQTELCQWSFVFQFLCMHACAHLSYFTSSTFTSPQDFLDNLSASAATSQAAQDRKWHHHGFETLSFWQSSVPPSSSPGHSLHLRTSQPWPAFPASFGEYSFCFVRVVAGGAAELSGPATLREEEEHRGNTTAGSMCAQKDESLLESYRLHLPR